MKIVQTCYIVDNLLDSLLCDAKDDILHAFCIETKTRLPITNVTFKKLSTQLDISP